MGRLRVVSCFDFDRSSSAGPYWVLTDVVCVSCFASRQPAVHGFTAGKKRSTFDLSENGC